MKILITSDWQADYENLDLCKAAAEEILQLKEELGFEVLVHAGDLKHVYNPVDVRVINFWMRTITAWKKAGLEVFICLGNHDRVGMHVDKQNWFPVLRKAGALAYDEASCVRTSNGQEIAILPFRNNSVLLKREASDLAKLVSSRRSVLIFHADVAKAKYNVLSDSTPGEKIQVDDLCPERYLFCVGGHIHFQQKLAGNVWYCGSPFATDWGESNQRKGYLFVDTENGTIRRIRSKAPGWYDPGWPGFEEAKPETWKGARIRIKVPCNGVQHVRESLEKARAEAERRFAGALVVCVPEFQESAGVGNEKIKSSFPDEKKIRIFVQETLPDELRKYESSVRKFLVEQLRLVGGLQREHGELIFNRVRAENFLSFDNLDISYEPGLCVIAGENVDWKGRSNGAGKSSYLQPVAVSLFGQTFKGQKHNSWVRRGADNKDLALVKLWFKDAQGRDCKILRSRQPVELKLTVGKEIVESGNRPESTQKLIEQVTGYTWETLANAIYIDQAQSHLMLTGTEAERKGFLAKLQNLERFERAEKAIRVQKTDIESRYDTVCLQLQSVLTEEKSLSDTISSAKRILAVNESIVDSYNETKKMFIEKKEQLRKWDEHALKERDRINNAIEELHRMDKEYAAREAMARGRQEVLVERVEKFEKLEGTCPTCEQIIDGKLIEIAIPAIEEKIRGLQKQVDGYQELERKRQNKIDMLREERVGWESNKGMEDRLRQIRLSLERKRFEMEQYEKQEKLLNGLRDKVKDCKGRIAELMQKAKKMGKWLKVLKYAQTVFQRNGLPAYLNKQVCPELNEAAKEYSELFAQGEIQVRFAVDDEGRMDVQVVNAHGGEEVEDQSEGEMKMASLITSFAVRSIAPKTNILILDEPGDGLDAVSARSFARGLKKIVGKFGTVLLTTHNPAILSELADAKLVTIRKQNGISEVVE